MPTATLRRQQRLTNQNSKAALKAGLRYVSDVSPGITRTGGAPHFHYLSAQGKPIRDPSTLSRIRSIVIPPAWSDVWICRFASGHIQAVGRDARGRKQYRYHPRWREARDETKYHKLVDFAKVLPRVRRAVARDLSRKGLPRERVLAAVIAVMERTLVRVGNDEYAAKNDSYGLTTLHDKHVKIGRQKVTFQFRGKSGVEHEIDLEDARLASIIRQCRDLPGEELFQYLDEAGNVHDVTSADVNNYLRHISGGDFTAKDFRTWAGTVLAARALKEFERFDSPAQAKRNLVAAIERVAAKLGNTKAVCRKCYVHPVVMESYLDGTLAARTRQRAGEMLRNSPPLRLSREEAAILRLLHDSESPARRGGRRPGH